MNDEHFWVRNCSFIYLNQCNYDIAGPQKKVVSKQAYFESKDKS